MSTQVITIAEDLIRRPSITPEDHGCQAFMMEFLTKLGFHCEKMDFEDTENFWATRGIARPCLIFAGHTDVVPPGDLEQWETDPFKPTHKDGMLYGRGAADMKGSLAAMLVATEQFVIKHPKHKGSIGFLITSDEEGPYINGTIKVVEELMRRQHPIDYAIVGEPSSTKDLGDVIKKGRRGSLTGWVTIKGVQGHVAYPHLAQNAVHESLSALAQLSETTWDNGNPHFPPTSFQITNVSAGTGAGNIVPGKMNIEFNFRYSTEQTADSLKQQVIETLDRHKLSYDIRWNLNGEPFLTADGELLTACETVIKEQLNIDTSAETTGGTSDGRFIAKTGAQIIELGPVNATIHKVNECVSTSDLEQLVSLYVGILEKLLVD